MHQDILIKAIRDASRRAGTQAALSDKTGIPQGRISDYLTGRYDVSNMTLKTLYKLFPDLVMDFFGEHGHHVAAKDIYGGVNQGGRIEGGIRVDNAGNRVGASPELLESKIYAEVMATLMDSEELEDTVKVKIFKILKPKK